MSLRHSPPTECKRRNKECNIRIGDRNPNQLYECLIGIPRLQNVRREQIITNYNFQGTKTSNQVYKRKYINLEENCMSKVVEKRTIQRHFNPVKAKLAYMDECFSQLRNGLPSSKDDYVEADRLTHSYVKSCFLMIVQRAVDINNAIIEFSGNTPPYQKHQSFRSIQESGAIDHDTLNFFEHALNCYEKIANPYEGLPAPELYDASFLLLQHGEAYTRQINDFFDDTSTKTVAEDI